MKSLLGSRIKELRKQYKLTLDDLAKTIGVERTYIWELENGRIKNPSFDKVLTIAKALGVGIEHLTDSAAPITNENVRHATFYRKMNELSEDDQNKLMQIVDAWAKNK